MKIAQVAPLYESVPPKLYGGTERVVSYLTEELVKQGHDLTLFASGDSITKAKLVSNTEQSLRLCGKCQDHLAYHVIQLQEIAERAAEFDVIHFHNDYIHFPLSSYFRVPFITTLHGRLDLAELQYVYNKFSTQPVISISNSQRKPLPQANWKGTVYHGLPPDLLKMQNGSANYFAFLGRVSPEKGVDKAIEIAKAARIKLKIAAKVDEADKEYFKNNIEKLLDDPLVEFIGEIGESQKQSFLGNALALLFPVNWPEPFGMVMIEAMACGTPVIAFNSGSVPEVIENGISGFIVNSIDEAVKAIDKLHIIPGKQVRDCFEKRFTAMRMADDYLKIFQAIINTNGKKKMVYMNDSIFIKNKRTASR